MKLGCIIVDFVDDTVAWRIIYFPTGTERLLTTEMNHHQQTLAFILIALERVTFVFWRST